jgi:hypothetical protein
MNIVVVKNFQPEQSARLAVTTTSSTPLVFTSQGGSAGVTFMISNSGTVGAYIAVGSGTNGTVTATVSTSTPLAVGNGAGCLYIAPGAIYTLDFPNGAQTIAAITASGTTTLEISVGYGS